ncbi:MAG: LptE family protein [Elusimicrobia bacterium]|nr:LptE family protein [Elusimicrobiota bacterium]
MKRISLVLLAAAWGCGQDIAYHPAPQLLPSNIKKVAIRLVVNKTQQFGLEDRLTLAIRDQALRSGQYPIVPEDDADGIVLVTITRYVLTPIQYDSTLIPTAYKLRVIADLQFIDRASNQILWEEKNMEGIQSYAAATLPGGMTEEQARELIWDGLSRDVVTRVVSGFGAVTGSSSRRITGDAPSTAPTAQPEKPIAPVNPNPY